MLPGGFDAVAGPEDQLRYLQALGVSCGERVLLIGGKIEIRWHLASAVVAISGEHLLSVDTILLDRLVERRFRTNAPEGRGPPWASRAAILWVRCDFPRKHSWNESVLNGLLVERVRKTTIVTMESEWVPVKVRCTRIVVDAFQFREVEDATHG